MIKKKKNLFLLDEIVKIEHMGERQTYDLTVPKNHNYFANGVLVHNSSSIEEDADALIGICRPGIAPDCPENLKDKIQLMVLANRFGKMYHNITLPYDKETSIISDD